MEEAREDGVREGSIFWYFFTDVEREMLTRSDVYSEKVSPQEV